MRHLLQLITPHPLNKPKSCSCPSFDLPTDRIESMRTQLNNTNVKNLAETEQIQTLEVRACVCVCVGGVTWVLEPGEGGQGMGAGAGPPGTDSTDQVQKTRESGVRIPRSTLLTFLCAGSGVRWIPRSTLLMPLLCAGSGRGFVWQGVQGTLEGHRGGHQDHDVGCKHER